MYLSCNSIIPGRSSRTEKYLGACASGKWVLNKSYMEACRAKGSFVEVHVSQIKPDITGCVCVCEGIHVGIQTADATFLIIDRLIPYSMYQWIQHGNKIYGALEAIYSD